MARERILLLLTSWTAHSFCPTGKWKKLCPIAVWTRLYCRCCCAWPVFPIVSVHCNGILESGWFAKEWHVFLTAVKEEEKIKAPAVSLSKMAPWHCALTSQKDWWSKRIPQRPIPQPFTEEYTSWWSICWTHSFHSKHALLIPFRKSLSVASFACLHVFSAPPTCCLC